MPDPVTTPPSAASAPPPPSPPATRRLVRSRDDRIVAGVAGGLARHLGVDPTLVRLAFVLLTLAGAAGVLAYLVAWLVLPEEPAGQGTPTAPPPDGATVRLAAGGFLVLLGLWWLLDALVPELGRVTWPAALIGVGLVIMVAGARR